MKQKEFQASVIILLMSIFYLIAIIGIWIFYYLSNLCGVFKLIIILMCVLTSFYILYKVNKFKDIYKKMIK